MTYKALDLYCGGGGSCIGLQQAGFDVYGIDIKPSKNYPGTLIHADIHDLPVNIHDFDFIWASPPCQRYSIGAKCSKIKNNYLKHPDLIPLTKHIIKNHPLTCIENVPNAPIRTDLILNGPAFGLNAILRKRIFELSFHIWNPILTKPPVKPFTIAKVRSATNKQDKERRENENLPTTIPKNIAKYFMGIPHQYNMTNAEIGESVPPPYARFIGMHAMNLLMCDNNPKFTHYLEKML